MIYQWLKRRTPSINCPKSGPRAILFSNQDQRLRAKGQDEVLPASENRSKFTGAND
jgi:hypothetical protein